MINQRSELLQNYINSCKIPCTKYTVKNSTVKNTYEIKNDSVDISDKNKPKTKKQKIAKVALLAATAGAVAIGTFAILRGKTNIAKDTGEIIGKAKTEAQKLGKYENGVNNITNIKDSVTRKFLMKIPGYEKFDNWSSNLYRKILTRTISTSHKKAGDVILNADKGVLEAIEKSKLDETKTTRLKELIEKRANAVKEFTSQESIQKRFRDVDEKLNRLDLDAMKKIGDVADKKDIEAAKELTTSSVVQKRLQEAKKFQNKLLAKYKNTGLNQNELKEFNSLLKELGNKELENNVSKADKLFNGTFTKESKDLFNKLRDVNCGSAPTDIMGIGLTAGTLGIYTAQADTKEEKVGVTLTTGIPLLTTLGTLVVATTKMVSGGKALGLATLTGFISKTVGGKINKIYQRKHSTENAPKTIVSYDYYANAAREFQRNLTARKTFQV